MNDQTQQNILLIKKVFIITTLLFLLFISLLFFFKKTSLNKQQSSRPSTQNYFPSSSPSTQTHFPSPQTSTQNYFIKTIEDANNNDLAKSISPTSDGGYIVVGETRSLGTGDLEIFTIKLDTNGNVSWAKKIDVSDFNIVKSISPTSDGGYIVVGDAFSPKAGSGDDIFIIKFDTNGNVSWAKKIGGANKDSAISVSPTSDGGYIVVGNTDSFGAEESDIFIIKLDANGNIYWAKTIGGKYRDFANSISPTSDGGYIIAGGIVISETEGTDIFTIKLDTNGNVSWAKTINITYSESAISVSPTSDGGYIVVGNTSSFGNKDLEIFTIKLDANGNVSWAKTIGSYNNDNRAFSVSPTSDGGYIVAGGTGGFKAGHFDVILIKLDTNGNIPGCSYLSSVSPKVSSYDIQARNISISSENVNPSVSSISLSAITQHPNTTNICLSPSGR